MSGSVGDRSILFATDGSQGSAAAEAYAFALARSWGASLAVLHVLEFPSGLDPESPVNRLYLAELMKQATQELVELKARAADRGFWWRRRLRQAFRVKKFLQPQRTKNRIWLSWVPEAEPDWHMSFWEVRRNELSGRRPARFWLCTLSGMKRRARVEPRILPGVFSGFWSRSIFRTVRSTRWSMGHWLLNDARPPSEFSISWSRFRTDWTSPCRMWRSVTLIGQRSPSGCLISRQRSPRQGWYLIVSSPVGYRLIRSSMRLWPRCGVDCDGDSWSTWVVPRVIW